MCGIVGYVGNRDTSEVLLKGLETLEYRGYDSAGIALFGKSEQILKTQGRVRDLVRLLAKQQLISAKMGFAHTRWATHGEASDRNAHPHHIGSVTLVHNGIIENYQELKKELMALGYHFQSDTDTEVLGALIDYGVKEEKDVLKALESVRRRVRGSYAICFHLDGEDAFYAMRKDSPLVIGIGKDETLIASDLQVFVPYMKQYLLLKEGEIAKVTLDGVAVYEKGQKVSKEVKTSNLSTTEVGKGIYPHYMLKEIMEEESVLRNLLDHYLLEDGSFSGFPQEDYDEIEMIGCGSAYYAGMIGKYLIETFGDVPVRCEIASEYRYQKHFPKSHILSIFISQSGETADTIASLRLAKELGHHTLGIVNVSSSTIAREADALLEIYAGPEVAVATTKAYLAQVMVLSLLALHFGIHKKLISCEELIWLKEDLRSIPTLLGTILADRKKYQSLAINIKDHNDIFFLGRGIDYAMSLEGSLKLKEISYSHSEAYQAGELKHGTISLIEEHTPVIAILTDETLKDKTISNIEEVKARGAWVLLVTTEKLDHDATFVDEKIVVPSISPLFQSVLVVPVLQLLAYEVALAKGLDIDKPRNLAKSVTVE